MKRLATWMLVAWIAVLPVSFAGCGQQADSAPATTSDSAGPDTPSPSEEDSPSSTTPEGSGY